MPEADCSIEGHQRPRQISGSEFFFSDHREDPPPVRPSLRAVFSSLHDPAMSPEWAGLEVGGVRKTQAAIPMGDDLLGAKARIIVLIGLSHRRVVYNN